MSTKTDVINAIADIATAAGALDAALANVRDANAGLTGTPVQNAAVIASGTSRAALEQAVSTAIRSLGPLTAAVDDAIVAADAVADALT